VIVVCTACPAQYSVPDAKIRGRKVRVTCKHCGTAFVVDATNEPERHQLRLEALEALAPATPPPADEDATRMMPKRADFSEHDEPTVIGQIPAAALEAERRYAQRTMPPPVEAPPAAPRALPHDVPEQALDTTHIASPQAKRASQASLPPPEANDAAILAAVRASRPSLPPQPAAEVKTLLSQNLLAPPAMPRPHRSLYWLLALVVVGGLALLTLTRR
jgi:predicted Zn finger-like uncharacterized protein